MISATTFKKAYDCDRPDPDLANCSFLDSETARWNPVASVGSPEPRVLQLIAIF
jgi:hypothetical protein